jgi:hypothetical protein
MKDLIGKRFGKILVISRCENKRYKNNRSATQWNCVCDCNPEKIIKITSNELRRGKINCGCEKKKPKTYHHTHGMSNTRLFRIWRSMHERCYNKNHKAYEKYGGRGIIICDEWLGKSGFQNLYNWAINSGYQDNLSIDRIDNDKGYCPENCRWATPSEQQRNRRDNLLITYKEETKTIKEWSEIFNLKHSLIEWRYYNNWPIENIFDPPRIWKSPNQSGIKGIIWQEHGHRWVVKGYKNGKRNTYVAEFKNLEDAIDFKEKYDKENPYPTTKSTLDK